VQSFEVTKMTSKQSKFRGFRLLVTVGICCVLAWALLQPLQASARARVLNLAIDFRSGKLTRWLMPYPQDWEILSANGLYCLHMKRARPPGVPRRPLQFARLKNVWVGSFELQARVRRLGSSMIVVFNYEDTLHFYYVHLSRDRGAVVSVHNGIFMVDGGPRYRIAGKLAKPALPDRAWHTVRIVRGLPSGLIQVYVDRQRKPLFHAVNRTFTCGQIGFGSFDETGDFADIQLHSSDAGCRHRLSQP
jgi:hypothetical protein